MQRDATDRTVEERHRHLQSSRALTQDRGPRYGGRPWTGDRSTSVLVDSELIGAYSYRCVIDYVTWS